MRFLTIDSWLDVPLKNLYSHQVCNHSGDQYNRGDTIILFQQGVGGTKKIIIISTTLKNVWKHSGVRKDFNPLWEEKRVKNLFRMK